MKFERAKENGDLESCELVKMVRGKDTAMVETEDVERFEKAGYKTVDYEPDDTADASDASDDDKSDDDKPEDGLSPELTEKVKAACSALEHGNDEHWTQDGKPSMKIIESLVGDPSISRGDVETISEGLRRNK